MRKLWYLLLIPIIFILSSCEIPTHWEVYKTLEIVSIRNDSEVNGAFVLGFGTINEDTYYTYFIKNDDGSYSLGKLYASHSVRIYEEDRLNGEIRFLNLVPDYKNIWTTDTYDYKTEIHVPKGTIIRAYRLQ